MQNENVFVAHALQIVKAVALNVLFCLAGVLVFSLVLKFVYCSDTAISVINHVIKALGILFGCFFALRGEKGWLKGIVSGILGVMITWLIFSLIGGEISVSWLIFAELAFGAIIGLLSGVIAVNVRPE